MLQPVDIAVAAIAAYRRHQNGAWAPKGVREDLNLPWSSLHLCLSRLQRANIIRNGRVNRVALAALLPILQYLIPVVPERSRQVRGIPTGASAPIFAGQIVASESFVWEFESGDEMGYAIAPLHPLIPKAVMHHPELHGVMACLDAARMGKARELAVAFECLQYLIGFPSPEASPSIARHNN
ncbi:MAG: hypothetical protein AAGB13_14070 [Cyanobacteria bacterium P01_F01_bin.33]